MHAGSPVRPTGPGRDAPATLPVGARIWLGLSVAAALIAIAGSVVGLAVDQIYADLTEEFLPQALAQDIVNLALVAPAMIFLAVLALRGSLRAYLFWLGAVTFTVYNYVIYTFSIPFGPLFLVWVAVLGLSIYALIGGLAVLDHEAVRDRFQRRGVLRLSAWFLIVVGALFALLWLSEDVPALLSDDTPQSVLDMALPTNPVHILDLAFFLPAVFATGVLLLKDRRPAHSTFVALLVFLLLTGVPIMVTPVVQWARGDTAEWSVVVPIGVLTVALVALLVRVSGAVAPGARLTDAVRPR